MTRGLWLAAEDFQRDESANGAFDSASTCYYWLHVNAGSDRRALTVFVDGVRYAGDPADIPLKSHEDIQIDVGAPAVAAQRGDWSKSQL